MIYFARQENPPSDYVPLEDLKYMPSLRKEY